MKEISKDMARFLFSRYGCGDANCPYLLYRDGSCRQIESDKDIIRHEFIFGVEED